MLMRNEQSVPACIGFLCLLQPANVFKATRHRMEAKIGQIKKTMSNKSTGSTDRLPKGKIVKAFQFDELSHKCAVGVFKGLVDNLSGCEEKIPEHKALLQLDRSSDVCQTDKRNRVDILLQICPPEPAKQTWQEVRCTFSDTK